MEPLVHVAGVVAPLLRDDVDTDAIIPAEFMRSLATDPGAGLFARWRYRPDGSEAPEFVLNDPRYRRAAILLAGRNFGCGSSRENAVWALQRFGIRCVVALGFSDIFRENAFKNGLLPLALPPAAHARLAQAATSGPLVLAIDVAAQTIRLPGDETIGFELPARQRTRLLAGTDDIDETLRRAGEIECFRAAHRRRAPWLYARLGRGDAGATGVASQLPRQGEHGR